MTSKGAKYRAIAAFAAAIFTAILALAGLAPLWFLFFSAWGLVIGLLFTFKPPENTQ